MRQLLAPEPVDWLREIEGDPLTPWALPFCGPGAFLKRRYLPGTSGWPGWTFLEALVRAWAGSDTARNYQARFALRRLVANLARPTKGTELLAPSLAALELFSRHQAKRVLLLDLPILSRLNQDLELAANANPQSRYLRRFRAERAQIVRQEQEFALADEIWVENRFAFDLLSARGFPCKEWSRPTRAAAQGDSGKEILLAGLATGRNGTFQILEILERHPEWRLRVRAGEGLEPAELLEHPQVSLARSFEKVGVVIAPSWVECHPLEVRQAEMMGIPIIATDRACGFSSAKLVPIGDSSALEVAVYEALDG